MDQKFDAVIRDREFYNKNVYKWLPDPSKGKADEKKLLGLAIEKEGMCMYALSAKCYSVLTEKGWSNRNRGVSTKEGDMTSRAMIVRGKDVPPSALGGEDYYETVEQKRVFQSSSLNLRVIRGVMSKIESTKNALTGVHMKMVVLSNQSCAPFIHGLDAVAGYCVVKSEEEAEGIDASTDDTSSIDL